MTQISDLKKKRNKNPEFFRIFSRAMNKGLHVRNLGIALKIKKYATLHLKGRYTIKRSPNICAKIIEDDQQYWAVELLKTKEAGDVAVFLKMVGDKFFPATQIPKDVITGKVKLF